MKFIVIIMAMFMTGCNHYNYTVPPSVRSSAEFQRFQDSTIQTERATVGRVNQLETQVEELQYRVCELEKRQGHKKHKTTSEELDRRFEKYMSK